METGESAEDKHFPRLAKAGRKYEAWCLERGWSRLMALHGSWMHGWALVTPKED